MTDAGTDTLENHGITLWMVDPLRESSWPQGDYLAGLSLQEARKRVATLNEGRDSETECFVLYGKDMKPLFA